MTRGAKGVPLVSTAHQKYDGRWVKPGQKFSVANEADARDLIALAFAKRDTGSTTAAVNDPAKATQ